MRLWNIDRLLLVWLYRLYPSLLDAIIVVKPETVIRWHRCGFRAYWRWKSRHVGGRPRIDSEIRALIRRMSRENPLWGAPRIHGELLMLGIEVAESTVGRYMVRRRRPPSRGWKDFPAQSCRWHLLRWICSSYARSRSSCSTALVILRHAPPAAGHDQRDFQSDRRVARRSGNRCFSIANRLVEVGQKIRSA